MNHADAARHYAMPAKELPANPIVRTPQVAEQVSNIERLLAENEVALGELANRLTPCLRGESPAGQDQLKPVSPPEECLVPVAESLRVIARSISRQTDLARSLTRRIEL